MVISLEDLGEEGENICISAAFSNIFANGLFPSFLLCMPILAMQMSTLAFVSGNPESDQINNVDFTVENNKRKAGMFAIS